MGVNKVINTHASDLRDEVAKINEADNLRELFEAYLAMHIKLALVAELQDLTTRAANGLTTRSDNTKGKTHK